ncbi:Electron transport complex protein RnfE [Candidatus Izimaplasma bacterium HR1]|jgi:electron transport complex protein RnfE|uniref:electron transport complex subunit RsxE n=1 Tax=Candidatus Izimoplasma sp. HR1 TaxID=1541959 RepID=UPI0004F68166|nr:Electron transport complex protein RnfE [Candidatus Izimaplasma bacterium HR1]
MSKKENFLKGFFKENPIFVFLLGMCPALATTSTFETALGMGILVVFVLTMSNIVVSLLRNLIPNDVRTPSYIVVIATFVTIVGMLTEWKAYALYEALGVFIPLIVVNCLILGRAESFASKNKVVDSAIDGLGMGLGFTFALVVIGFVRELLSTGSIMYGNYLPFFVDKPIYLFTFDWLIDGVVYLINLIPNISILVNGSIEDVAIPMFALPAGAFIALGLILSFIQSKQVKKAEKLEAERKALIAEKRRIALEKKKAAALKKVGESA